MTEPRWRSPRHEVESHLGIEFGRPGGHALLLDLHRPVDVPHSAIVLYLHGGGWMTGTRKSHAVRARRLAEHGIAVASIDYRLSPVAPFPAQLIDVASAIDWVKREGQDFGLDPNRLALWGASAGAHLALLSVTFRTIPHVESMTPGPAVSVKAVIGLFGNYDLTSRGDRDRPHAGSAVPREILQQRWPPGVPVPPSSRHLRARLLGVEESTLADRDLAGISPLSRAEKITVPAFLLHGTHDAVTSVQQSRRMAQELRRHGQIVRLQLVEGANHEDPVFESPATIANIATFLHDHLVGSTSTNPTKETAEQGV